MATLERAGPIAPAVVAASPGWLRGRSFDLLFISGVAGLAILASAAVVAAPALFPLVLVADMWLLGFHHVLSTFTRLAFDSASFRAHRFLVLGLPPLVLAGTVALMLGVGQWAVPTLYLYWQWFHYTRQSYGIAQIYRRKAGIHESGTPLAKGVIYLLPLWGILHRSWQAPATFLDMEIKVLPVPLPLVQAAAAATVAVLAVWAVQQVRLWRQGRLPLALTLYLLSHLAVFAAGYLLIADIDYGWLAINVWHNAQYILIVWMYNNNRFKGGVDPRHRFLSTLSQRERTALYFAVCLALSTAVYLALQSAFRFMGLSVLALTLIAYQTINFHHYIVDGVIWKVRKPHLRANLGLAG